MQDYLAHSGYNEIKGPRASITQMARDGMLDPFIWENILTARNEVRHIYDEAQDRAYLSRIVNDFEPAFQAFRKQMEVI